MQDTEREILRANAEQLADLLTENVPYLLNHYLKNGVLDDAEREHIIQGTSSPEIRLRLVKTLAEKEGVSIQDVIEGLDATENHCVSAEIKNLLSDGKTGEEVVDNGSGDKTADLSTYATNLVDEVIAKAEKTTAAQLSEEEVETAPAVAHEEIIEEPTQQPTNGGEPSISINNHDEQIADKLVETSVQVHTTETDAPEEVENNENDVGVNDESITENDTTYETISDVNEESLLSNKEEEDLSSDVPDRNVNFSETVSTIIEDGKHNNQFEEENVSPSPTSPTPPSTENYHSHGLDYQNESENENVDDIDIEKEFVMPPEAETNINNNSVSNGKIANGTNDIVLEEEEKIDESRSVDKKEDSELAAILARKALVRQQVELFEKNSPGPGKVKYSFRTAAADKEPQNSTEGNESKVKNLKNFFQRLSTTESTSSPPSGPAKSVGKLKVTFPATS